MDIEKLMLPIAEFTEYGEVCFAHLSENGERRLVWDEYKQLIEETEMEYSERKVKLHNVRSKMNAFIYQFSCKAEFMEDEQIGELYYIENGEVYFDENDILRRELFEEGKDLFI